MKSMACDRLNVQTYTIEGNRCDESNYEIDNRNLKEKLHTAEATITANATEISGLMETVKLLTGRLRIHGQTSNIEKVRILQ